MRTAHYQTEEPIVALATPWAASALAVVRVSGRDSIELASRCFPKAGKLPSAKTHTIHFARMHHPESGELLDEVTVAVFRAPHGYTGEEAMEISCHGSLAGIRKVIEALKCAGFRDAAPGEFTFRAFMHGKIDLTRAEAVQEIVSAKSRKAHALALNRLSGKLYRYIDEMKQQLVKVMSHVEIQLDYAEDEVLLDQEVPIDLLERIGRDMSVLAETYHAGKVYSEGLRIALAGATNAGKSSLFNLFLKEDRSIVSDIHGTTRDYIESWISLEGIPLRLYDTAGFRSSSDLIEEEGIRRSTQLLDQADLILYLNGADDDPEPELSAERVIRIWNKADIREGEAPEGYIPLSTLTGEGFSALEQAILKLIAQQGIASQEQEVMIDSLRQQQILLSAADALEAARCAAQEGLPLDIIAPELQLAAQLLGEITGEVTSADILDTIFSGFCVGK